MKFLRSKLSILNLLPFQFTHAFLLKTNSSFSTSTLSEDSFLDANLDASTQLKINKFSIESLIKSKWTLFLGDDVLNQQFLELMSNVVKPKCTADSAGTMTNHAFVDSTWITQEQMNPVKFLQEKPQEWAAICEGQKDNYKCEFKHLDCFHFNIPMPLGEEEDEKTPKKRQCTLSEWNELVAELNDTNKWGITSHFVDFAILRKGPNIEKFEQDQLLDTTKNWFVERFKRFQPGSVVMNSCLSIPSSVADEEKDTKTDTETTHLPESDIWQSNYHNKVYLYLQTIKNNIELFKQTKIDFTKTNFVYQGCPPLECHFVTKEDEKKVCNQIGNDRLLINSGIKQVVEDSGVQFFDVAQKIFNGGPNKQYANVVHPCQIRPCSWDAEITTKVVNKNRAYSDKRLNFQAASARFKIENEQFKNQTKQYAQWSESYASEIMNVDLIRDLKQALNQLTKDRAALEVEEKNLEFEYENLPVLYSADSGNNNCGVLLTGTGELLGRKDSVLKISGRDDVSERNFRAYKRAGEIGRQVVSNSPTGSVVGPTMGRTSTSV